MRTAALVLTLVFGGLQTVALTDCCCISACELTPPKHGDCGNCAAAAPQAPADDCCSEPAPRSEKPGCVHVRPSPDVVSHAHDAPVSPPSAVLLLPVVEPLAAPAADVGRPAAFEELHRSERGRPLWLLDCAFLS